MKKIVLPGGRGYNVHVGESILKELPKWLKNAPEKRAFVISDRNLVAARETLKQVLEKAKWECHEIPVVAGEGFKNIESLMPLYGQLLKERAGRDSVIFALGGGSIGDGAGFLAATYLRGVPWVGVPTSLLSQVDSAIGGKTGINHPMGKNLIGAFHQPQLVVCDISLLKTLSSREVISGLGEAIKYGITYDPKFFDWLVSNWHLALQMDSKVMTTIVSTSVKWKIKAVQSDEFDRKGVREVLNFGHTFGHALEAATRYETYQHGEAVLWGMRFALALSVVRKKMNSKEYLKIDGFLRAISVPPLPLLHSDDMFKPMVLDKKIKNGKLHFVLLTKLGKTVSDRDVAIRDLEEALKMLRGSLQ